MFPYLSVVSSRKSISSKYQHMMGCLNTKFSTKVRKTCTVNMTDSSCEHSSCMMAKRSISSPSPDSSYISKYYVLISAIQSQEVTRKDTKSVFPSSIFLNLLNCVFHAIRIAFVYYSFKAGLQFSFSSLTFRENVIWSFLKTVLYARLFENKKDPL